MKIDFRLAVLGAISAALFSTGCTVHAQTPDPDLALRFAVLGDAEPKPEAAFPGVEAAVRDVNVLAGREQIDFVVGVGDLAHKGTVLQYDNVTPVLQQLSRPFYPIMGNEEHNQSVARYLGYARQWNPEITSESFVQDHGRVTLVYASPNMGRDFHDDGIDWILEQMRAAPNPVFLVVHAAQVGVYPENAEKGVENERFAEVIAQPKLAAVISGDLHMDMDRTVHSKQIGQVHYLHIPGLERTKIPDETRHTPMFRVFTITQADEVHVQTYETGNPQPLERHAYSFSIAALRNR
ncbi:metallophosphoesterase [Altererythrobacter sp. KTW20L]|uniref:metallophosphoesterase family protein n=1 Tax=Altererythrobacter sp. KTW20L TaxID=2942210 RepID=UPI0020C01658|nr:metallophosphoesterase [Altererythrobacter sp. KTW20L]MCL6250822.1 metallophosphoesterase [Altererythrobacter sp. KTW20L]